MPGIFVNRIRRRMCTNSGEVQAPGQRSEAFRARQGGIVDWYWKEPAEPVELLRVVEKDRNYGSEV
jgi:hypothetical protein